MRLDTVFSVSGRCVEPLAALVDVYAVSGEGGQEHRGNLEVPLVVPEVLQQTYRPLQMAVRVMSVFMLNQSR